MYRYKSKGKETTFSKIVEEILKAENLPKLLNMVWKMGPTVWETAAERVMTHNLILGQCFKSVAKFLKILEVDKETWPQASII
jgi:hypothetical protein